MGIKLGYIAGSFKPYHAGHHYIIESAARECEKVFIFASIADRSREGEVSIKGSVMHEIWAKYLLAIMPSNVEVSFVKTPIRSLYETVGEADKTDNDSVIHIIYGDNNDLSKNFPEKNLTKYFPKLHSKSQIDVRPFCRTETVNISGTTMRKFIQLGLVEDFIKGLPEPVRPHGQEIWKLLAI